MSRSSPMSVISTKSSVVSASALIAPPPAATAVATSTTNTTSLLSGHAVLGRGQSPRGPSPNRERDSYK